MVQSTLTQLQNWYNEPSQGQERTKLLSKLATLELCGWIEGEIDRIIMQANVASINDNAWVQENIIDRTNGFNYNEHIRSMFLRIYGEFLVRRIEKEFEMNFPGDLDQLKSLLGTLWRYRCTFAHTNIVAQISRQTQYQAPSWAINQHRLIARLLLRLEATLLAVLQQL
ncbi:MAG: hypothetical protein H6872_12340 [Methylobacteriaceae bacterium]|nr:hypothetical protein [Rhodoblastus sp.]MCC0005883.1 hypothetical protein [Methylobacteriaceae bacterium]